MRRSTLMLTALAAMMWMSGCSDKDPVSSQNEGADSPAGKLVISSTKAGRGLGAGGPVGTMRKITAKLPGGAYMKFVLIDPGTFTMGSPSSEPGRFDNEVQHQVTLTKGFYLGQYEITQGQWEAVMGTTPWVGGDGFVGRNNPAVNISWNDVQKFVGKLNQDAGDSLYRLPTEAEWEYAARAGTTTTWSFGDDASQLGNYAWWRGNRSNNVVGTKLPNPWGLYDMHGGAGEWVQDWYGEYSSGKQTNPEGPTSGSNRIERGGGHDAPAEWTRSAVHTGSDPDLRDAQLGARLVRIKK